MSIETLREKLKMARSMTSIVVDAQLWLSRADIDAILAHLQPSPVLCEVDELRAGEMNDGELDSRDLLIEGRGITVLINSGDGTTTYSLRVDGKMQGSGLLWKRQPSPDLRGNPSTWDRSGLEKRQRDVSSG